MSWSSPFPEAIVLPDGGSLRTLRDAVAHLGKTVPKSDHDMPAVTIAAKLLTMAAEHGAPIEFARIATLQAINRHGVREFTDRKAHNGVGENSLSSRLRLQPAFAARQPGDGAGRESFVVGLAAALRKPDIELCGPTLNRQK